MSESQGESQPRIGVLALQGAFREHISIFRDQCGVDSMAIRTADELSQVDALVIPGMYIIRWCVFA